MTTLFLTTAFSNVSNFSNAEGIWVKVICTDWQLAQKRGSLQTKFAAILSHKKENPDHKSHRDSLKIGSYLLSHLYAVPSALVSLTSLFGMGRGGPSLL